MDDAINNSQAYWKTQAPPHGVLPETEPSPYDLAPEPFTLGMSSFDEAERHRVGQSLRLSMALIEGKATSTPSPRNPVPDNAESIKLRLQNLGQDISACQSELLALLIRFDDLKGWKPSGARHCAAWMTLELGISKKSSWEYLRAGRQLQNLPIMTALFRSGRLSWSKVRLITRVADKDNESQLCHIALDASVCELENVCNEYRWQKAAKDDGRNSESERALKQWEARSLRWDNISNGNVRISLCLPPELAQAFLNSVEYSMGQMEPSEATMNQTTMTQKRADAAILMAETNLQSAGRDIATADRYQVIVSVDASELRNNTTDSELCDDTATSENSEPETLSKRTTIVGAASGTSPLAKDTARRLACDCTVSAIINDKAEPVNIGRKSRNWPAAMARAIKLRDKTCVYPGCTQSQHLQIHHIVHWADGGLTSVDNGACVCSYHHTLLHEGGYHIERVADNEQRLEEQFARQAYTGNAYTSSQSTQIEQELRDNHDSFNSVRQCMPERFRFRVVDSNGFDVAHRKHSPRGECLSD